MAKKSVKAEKSVEAFQHKDEARRHIPTAEYQTLLGDDLLTPVQVAYTRRNPDLDPQLVWRGKDLLTWSDLVVQAPPLYIQEKIHPKVLIDDLRRQSQQVDKAGEHQLDFFADFNGLPEGEARTEFYQHDANWSNRMILGDSLQVMASLAEREGLRGKVQCIYIDPPYGIKFNSNFQWSTTSRDVKTSVDHITREPEQVKAFRDTWRMGIHSYLEYIRDRLILARDLLSESGSIFIQMGEQNVHLVRVLLDEVFGIDNFFQQVIFRTTAPLGSDDLAAPIDYILWYAKNIQQQKFRPMFEEKLKGKSTNYMWTGSFEQRRRLSSEEVFGDANLPDDIFYPSDFASSGYTPSCYYSFTIWGNIVKPGKKSWRTNQIGGERLIKAERLMPIGPLHRPCYIQYFKDNPSQQLKNTWMDTRSAMDKICVVQTQEDVIKRCVLMTTDPGDIVLDPTCGSGTTAYVAEQWGRRWITIDTSRVALALARMRLMGGRYPYYLLRDSREGQLKEAEVTRNAPSSEPTYGSLRQGFVYERVPHITLKSIANNVEIDVIYETYQAQMEPVRSAVNAALHQSWEEWQIPREADPAWPAEARALHAEWWRLRIARQKEIDASIAAKADYEYLYDKPYQDNKKVPVAGPFTVESLMPHRMAGVDENDELIDGFADNPGEYVAGQTFDQKILENLKLAGVQQAHKADKISFFSLTPWPGNYICAEGRYFEGSEDTGRERRAGIFIGPEFGTVSRPDLVAAAREAGDAGFDVLIACAFNYDAHSTEFSKLGAIPVLKARMNADLHMADDLKSTGAGNLFVIFGEPDIELLPAQGGQVQIKLNGVDVFDPSTGEVRSDDPDTIACWFVDTDYNEESFFVRQAYFLGANDPYGSLKTTLKAEINEEAWESLYSDVSSPFDKPAGGRIAVKVINHLGDEVMKVFRVN